MGMGNKVNITSQGRWEQNDDTIGKRQSDLFHSGQFFKVVMKYYEYSLKLRLGKGWQKKLTVSKFHHDDQLKRR